MAPVPYQIGTGTSATLAVVTITSGVTTRAGDTLVVGADSGNTSVVTGITDTAGNTYAQANSNIAQNPASIWVAQGATKALPAGGVITVTWNSATAAKAAAAVGCSGLLTAVDQNPASTSNAGSTAPSITSGTLSAAKETAVAFCVYGFVGGASLTWAAGWTTLVSPFVAAALSQWTGMAYTNTPGVGTLTASGTITSARWAMFLLTFVDTAVPAVVNQWTLSPGQSYGLDAVPVSNTPGNMLVAFIGWQPGVSSSVSPVSNVADDANNTWAHLGTTPVSGMMRCSIWCAPNTRPGPGSSGGASVVSIATSAYVSGLCALVVEYAGMPQYAVTDFETSTEVTGTALSLSGAATVPDVVLAVFAGDNPLLTFGGPGAGWQTLDQVTFPPAPSGPTTQPGWMTLFPAWMPAPAGTVTASWTSSGTQDLAGAICALQAQPASPVQPNLNWPILATEAAFGYQPGNPQTIPSWTDISSYAIGAAGSPVISAKRGRSYELTQPETGELRVTLNNSAGVFTPGNTASPFYPNIAVELGVRVTGWWNGSYYRVGMGYAERLPQSWPEMPQFGFTPLTATDGLGVLANAVLPSALAGDYLIDSPYVYIPCGEEYAAGTAVSGQVYGSSNTGAAGLTLANLSRTNTQPAVALNGVARLGSYPTGSGLAYWLLETGQTLGLTSAVNNSPTGIIGAPLLSGILGDPGGGIGISTLPSSGAGLPGWLTGGLFTAPGARYSDPGLPQITAGLTVEFWAIMPAGTPAGFTQTLLRLDGGPPPYHYNSIPGRLLVNYAAGAVNVILSDYKGDSVTLLTLTIALQDGNPHFYSVTVFPLGGGSYSAALYIDGAPEINNNTSLVAVTADVNVLAIGPVMGADGAQWLSWNYTIGHVAVFPSVLPSTRIAAHYAAGITANTGDSGPQRAARILAWSGFGVARACDLGSPSPVFGPADQVQGQTGTAALYSVAQQDNGMLYCDAAGNVTIRSRANLYNRPVKWWFGDAPVPGGVLNQNSTFAGGTSPWTAVNSAVLARSTAWSHDGAASLQITGNGSAANPGAASEMISVTAGVTYMVNGWCYSPQGWSAVQASIGWYNSAAALISQSTGAVLNLQAQAPMVLPQVTATAPAGAVKAQVTVQMNGVPGASVQLLAEPLIFACAEVPYLKPTGFGYDNTFLWNLLTAKQQIDSAYSGSSATVINPASQEQYFTRGGQSAQIDQTLETLSFQDVLDEVNWSIAKYAQPQIRMERIVVDASGQAGGLATWPTVLGVEQGDICSVIRRPIGGAVISETGIVQKVQHDVGPSKWVTTILVVPYNPAGDVLVSDTNGAVGGNAAIPW